VKCHPAKRNQRSVRTENRDHTGTTRA
jgi:hypothetical protein